MSKKMWAEEIAEAEEALRNARMAARVLWLDYQQALKEADEAEQQLMKLRLEGPANARGPANAEAKPGGKEKA